MSLSLISSVIMSSTPESWKVRGVFLIRHHGSLRVQLFSSLIVRDILRLVVDLQLFKKSVVMGKRLRFIRVKSDVWSVTVECQYESSALKDFVSSDLVAELLGSRGCARASTTHCLHHSVRPSKSPGISWCIRDSIVHCVDYVMRTSVRRTQLSLRIKSFSSDSTSCPSIHAQRAIAHVLRDG